MKNLKLSLGMNDWVKVSLLLSIFGFLKEIRPSEPFVFEFLIGNWRNITAEQVSQDVYPVGTYSYLAQLVIVFLITDLCRYKFLIVILGLSGIVIWSMLLWTKSLLELQILEILYGTFMATEVAYFTYIYAKVRREHYQQVTSHTRAAILFGRFMSGTMAQFLVSFAIMDYRQLNYITLTAMIAATLWCFLLPSVKKSIYFHQYPEADVTLTVKYKKAFSLMETHFLESYGSKHVIKWSAWWALATCGFIQVQVYMQPLWSVIVDDPENSLYNGAVEAVLTLIGFLGALLAGVLKTDWKQKGELILSVCSFLQGALMLLTSQTNYILVSYICYVSFGGLFHFMITIASSEIAKYIKEDTFGLVFGFNTLIALSLQTLVTLVFVTGSLGFALSPRRQYLVYGFYHIGIAAIFIIIGMSIWLKKSHKDINKIFIH